MSIKIPSERWEVGLNESYFPLPPNKKRERASIIVDFVMV
jgi:hypothetical protein